MEKQAAKLHLPLITLAKALAALEDALREPYAPVVQDALL